MMVCRDRGNRCRRLPISSLRWLVLMGYWFLDKGEASNAILASLGSITAAALERQVVRVVVRA